MVSIQGQLDRIFRGDFKGVFNPSKTVTIEQDQTAKDSSQYRLRFGKGKDDYFLAEGDPQDIEALQEIVSKVIESPTQLKKIKDLPVSDRPILLREKGMGNVGGYCNGRRIAVAETAGTGYKAAATFVHEFQHQYQFKHDAINHYKGNLSLAEDILDDRLCESAAQTASYQYLYEMKDRNLQTKNVYRTSCKKNDWYSQGLLDYSAAKEAGKNEGECILAGMSGYASHFALARCYERDYHSEIGRTDPSFGVNGLADYLQEGRKEDIVHKIDQYLGGQKLDETAAFLSHTTGMTDQPPEPTKIKESIRSEQYAYVTTATMRFLNMAKETYEKFAGKKHEKADEVLSVRDQSGVYDSSQPEKKPKRTLMDRLRDFRKKLDKEKRNVQEPFKLPVFPIRYGDGTKIFSLDGRIKSPDQFSAGIFYRDDIACEKKSGLHPFHENIRTDKMLETFAVLMKDDRLRAQLTECGSANPLIVGFGQKPQQGSENMIALDWQKSSAELAQDFRKQWEEIRTARQKTAGHDAQSGLRSAAQQGASAKPSLNAKLMETQKNLADAAQKQSVDAGKNKSSFAKTLMAAGRAGQQVQNAPAVNVAATRNNRSR